MSCDLKQAIAKAKSDNSIYTASGKISPGETTTEDEAGGIRGFFNDVKGAASSTLGGVALTITGSLETVKSTISKILHNITDGFNSIASQVSEAAAKVSAPLTEAQEALQAQDRTFLTKFTSKIPKKILSLSKEYGTSIVTSMANSAVNIKNPIVLKGLTVLSKFVKEKTKSTGTSGLKAKGTGDVSESKKVFKQALSLLPGEIQENINSAISETSNKISEVEELLDETITDVINVAEVLNKPGEKLPSSEITPLAACLSDISLESLKSIGSSFVAAAVMLNKRIANLYIDQLITAESSSATLPISMQEEVRSVAIAEMQSSRVISDNIKDTITNANSLYGDVGSTPGGTILGYTADTTNLDLELWARSVIYTSGDKVFSVGPAMAIRSEVNYKIGNSAKDMIQSSYEILNSYTVRCMPSEFPEGESQLILRDPVDGSTLTPHDFRNAGDTTALMAIGRNKSLVQNILRQELGKLYPFVKYISPVSEKASITDMTGVKHVTIEGYEFTVDIKGSKVIPAAESADHTPLV